MRCRKCGYEIKDDDVYCGKCGTKVENDISNDANANKNVLKISLNKFIMLIGLVAVITLIIVLPSIIMTKNSLTKVNNTFTNETTSIEQQENTTNNKNGYILDIIDEENQEFKINGQEFIDTICRVEENIYKKGGIEGWQSQVKVLTSSNGITAYGISSTIVSSRIGAIYPRILVYVNDTSKNVVSFGAGFPFDGSGYNSSALASNLKYIALTMGELGYNELWDAIRQLVGKQQTDGTYVSNSQGVYAGLGAFYQNENCGSDYYMFYARPIDME